MHLKDLLLPNYWFEKLLTQQDEDTSPRAAVWAENLCALKHFLSLKKGKISERKKKNKDLTVLGLEMSYQIFWPKELQIISSRSSDGIWDHQRQSRPSAASLLLQFLFINCWPNITDSIPFNKRRKLAEKTEINTAALRMNPVVQTSNTGFIKAWPKCSFGYGIAGKEQWINTSLCSIFTALCCNKHNFFSQQLLKT